MIRALVALGVCVVSACQQPAPPAAATPLVQVQVPAPTLPVERPWVATLAAVQLAVDSGRFGAADSILTDFERSEPGTRDASESAFWRAMLRADPRNPAFTPAGARAALEELVAASPGDRRTEVQVLLRLLALSDSLRTSQTAQRAATEVRDRARDEELQRLRDDLARTQAELDRIKRRLGPPKPQ